MEVFRRYFVVILLTIIVAIVWGGILLFSGRTSTSINPNAEMYVKPLNPKFDEEVVEEVSNRAQESFPISTEDFRNLDTSTLD